jgi:5-methylcytosine-specific restriction endonuclease McrA
MLACLQRIAEASDSVRSSREHVFVSGERFDWGAVRKYYEAGHTRDQCQTRFGFSNGAWNRAVERGDIEPRPKSSGMRASEKRRRVGELRGKGMSYVAIARELGLAKATVAYHARRLGIPASEKFARRYDWARVQGAIDEGLSMRRCRERFGFSRDAWGKAVKRGDIVPGDRVMPISELLVVGRRTNRGHLKKRLLNAGLKENRCERCGISEWRGRRLSMQLHHVNGEGLDNRLENLEFLCGNCHSQTDTYGGRNGHRRKRGVEEPPPGTA